MKQFFFFILTIMFSVGAMASTNDLQKSSSYLAQIYINQHSENPNNKHYLVETIYVGEDKELVVPDFLNSGVDLSIMLKITLKLSGEFYQEIAIVSRSEDKGVSIVKNDKVSPPERTWEWVSDKNQGVSVKVDLMALDMSGELHGKQERVSFGHSKKDRELIQGLF